ncbi:MAG: glycosyl transferase [Lentisphaeria bacterium]|nr:glycosyl transferase [Lentisphaeria bacterium]
MKITNLIKNPYRIFSVLAAKGWFDRMPDERFLRLQFRAQLGKWPDLESPQTFNEKLQWLKLYDRRPEYTMMTDKYRVREYIKEKIGEEYLIPLLGVWDDPDEIDFDALPEQFVLKCNHNSGKGMCICRDKSRLDIAKVKEQLRQGLAQDYWLPGREWPYKDIPRKIVCEKYMEDSVTGELRDYKFFCFNGIPLYCQVIADRFGRETIDFFDMEWNHQEFTGLELPLKPHASSGIEQPETFSEMIACAACLSAGHAFLRVDFYEVNQKMYFGELTFYPASGFGTFSAENWNCIFGEHLLLDGQTSFEVFDAI